MNNVESAGVMKRLRKEIVTYLNHIFSLLLIREQDFLPVPFPDDPTGLPPDFPHGDCIYTFEVQWDDAEHQVQHNFKVTLFHFRPEPAEQQITWKLVFERQDSGEPQAQIGLFFVDRLLYENQRLYQITGRLVLVSLIMSVDLAKPVYMQKITLASANAPHTSAEVIQLAYNGFFIYELARQEF